MNEDGSVCGSLRPLPTDFFCRSASEVARELLGHLLVHRFDSQDLILRIVETEAYLGLGDRASHAWRGRPTPRTKVLFGPGGIAYVYLVYGLHDMFNVVTGEEGDGSAVLVRSGVPISGEQRMKENRGLVGRISAGDIAGGPGKLCQALQIDRDLNGARLDQGELRICRGQSIEPGRVVTGPRVGVDYAGAAAGWPLRYAESGNPHVSRPSPG